MQVKLIYIGCMFDPESERVSAADVGANNHSPSDVLIILELIGQFDHFEPSSRTIISNHHLEPSPRTTISNHQLDYWQLYFPFYLLI